MQQQANVTAEVEMDGRETINEIELTHHDKPSGDFAFTPTFNQLFHKQSKTEQKSAHKKVACMTMSRMMSCALYFFDEGHEQKTHNHVTPYFSSCAVFAFLRFFHGSLYYGVVALSDVPGKCSEYCRVPCVCCSESTPHFSFNYHSFIFLFSCTGECPKGVFFVLVTL